MTVQLLASSVHHNHCIVEYHVHREHICVEVREGEHTQRVTKVVEKGMDKVWRE